MTSHDNKGNYEGAGVDLITLYTILKKHFLIISLFTLGSALIGGLISFYYLTPIYEAKALIMVNHVSGDSDSASSTLNTYVGQVKSDVLMQQVINKLHLKQQDISAGRLILPKFINKSEQNAQAANPRSLSKQIQTKAVKDSNLMEITVENKDPQMAAQIANTLSQEFMLLMAEKNKELVDNTVKSLRAQIISVQQQMANANDPAEKQLYADTLALLVDRTKVAYSIDMGNIGMVVTSPALEPSSPVGPNKKVNILLSFLLGLMVSIVIVFVRESLNNKIRTPEEVAQHLDLPVLGTIMHAGRQAVR